MSLVVLPDLNALPADALQALILSQHEQLISREREIEHLKLLIAKLRRMQFGRKSEKLERQIEQLELRLDELESKRSEQEPNTNPSCRPAPSTPKRATRRALPDHLPRQVRRHEPKETVARNAGRTAQVRRGCLGDAGVRAGKFQGDSAGAPEAELHELRLHRAGGSAEPPDRARPCRTGTAGARVWCRSTAIIFRCIAKSEIYARQGVELERSTLADWVGGTSQLLEPLVEALRRYVMSRHQAARR